MEFYYNYKIFTKLQNTCALKSPTWVNSYQVNILRQATPATKGLYAWASCQIRKIPGYACAGNAGNVFPATAGQLFQHASRHVRDARAVMHDGIAN